MDEAISGLTEINSFSTELNESAFNMAGYIIATILAIALIFVVYSLSTDKPHAKEYLIAWIIAIIFALAFVIGEV
ncbi:MAG: hypothetical protein LBJ72_01600 [Dysgonamonadaceae bacterium]|jgi:lipopolysaccharide export LptBFGC system permease protein LptF|nr:hypothetical protein [Dysgonamonadaceae bacterium]